MTNCSLDFDRLLSACDTVRDELLAERAKNGCWTGELSSSPLATATAISALVLSHSGDAGESRILSPRDKEGVFTPIRMLHSDLSELIVGSLHWLARHQNEDGGWGDADRCRSNVATTILIRAAFQLTGVPAKYVGLVDRADAYIAAQGGVVGLRQRYGKDKSFAVPILANCALAGMADWRQVPQLPFELVCLPKAWQQMLRLPVVSYAIPGMVAIGQARFVHDPPRNPLTRFWRKRSLEKSLRLVERMQPDSGGFLDAVPLTSFVVMALASIGHVEHTIVRRGVEFLLASVRGDGSWPIVTNLATWNTSLALSALLPSGEAADDASAGTSGNGGEETLTFQSQQAAHFGMSFDNDHQGANVYSGDHQGANVYSGDHQGANAPRSPESLSKSIDWLLGCQLQKEHPYNEARRGGWAWTDLPAAIPDTDDTAAALLALSQGLHSLDPPRRLRVLNAARRGADWLLDMQNPDGGWPTFSRGLDFLPFDSSANDLTAHAIRSLAVWKAIWSREPASDAAARKSWAARRDRIERAVQQGLAFLSRSQREDGSWTALWFGNQWSVDGHNRVYGTAQVLATYAALGRMIDPAPRAIKWLLDAQWPSGGWGPVPQEAVASAVDANGKQGDGSSRKSRASVELHNLPDQCSVEETSWAVDALLCLESEDAAVQSAIQGGLEWLCEAISAGRHHQPSPVGLYFANMWYHERLYPHVFAGRALGRAVRRLERERQPAPAG